MIYTIQNNQLKVSILDVGASILSMQVLKEGAWIETTLQYDHLDTYAKDNPYYLNSVIGPHSGRIKEGKYTLKGEVVQLETNDRGNHLHGGANGFHTLKFYEDASGNDFIFLRAIDTVNACIVKVKFKVKGLKLHIDFEVETKIDQVINMTQHTYFNLDGSDSIENHSIQVDAAYYSKLDESGVPEAMVPVEGPFDMRESGLLKDKMAMHHPQFEISGNIDHVFEVRDGGVKLSAGGLGVYITSNRPYVVVYTGNYFLGETAFKGSGISKKHQAVAVEPQYLPNDVNLGLGESQIAKANETYMQSITYEFYY